jgi:hypothetical protein
MHKKELKIGKREGRWCQVLKCIKGDLGKNEEIKNPCGGRGWTG